MLQKITCHSSYHHLHHHHSQQPEKCVSCQLDCVIYKRAMKSKTKIEILQTWRMAFAFSKIAVTLTLAVGPDLTVGFSVAVGLRLND